VAKAYPAQPVHIVWDNLNTHRAAVWEDFNVSLRLACVISASRYAFAA
jgi:hypothetical protein